MLKYRGYKQLSSIAVANQNIKMEILKSNLFCLKIINNKKLHFAVFKQKLFNNALILYNPYIFTWFVFESTTQLNTTKTVPDY